MIEERHLVPGTEVFCFGESGNHVKGFVFLTLYSKLEKDRMEPGACIVDHGGEKKTWLLDQMLPVEVCPDGLIRLLDEPESKPMDVVPSRIDAGFPDITESVPPSTLARETSDPLFLMFDASAVPPEALAQAKGRPFVGADGKKLGDILSVNGTQMIVEVDAYLADDLRKKISQGKGPKGCVEYAFPKRDTAELGVTEYIPHQEA